MKSFRADYVFPVNADPIKNGIVTVDEYGKIVSVENHAQPGIQVEQLSGVLCPGFVNTHCHVELSHLHNQTSRSTGLVNFIKEVQQFRNADTQLVAEAAARADEEMYTNGIVAVGDISNSAATIPIKATSKLKYHTFIEVFSFLPERASQAFENALQLLQQFKPLSASITPHAPYSVSKELFRLIKNYCDDHDNLLSIHNQESDEENKFYRYKLGNFLDLYEHFGMDISYFKPQARNSIQSMVPLLSNRQEVLLVHNTCTNLKDIYFVKRFDRKINWCFCPNANLYIEGKLPKVDLFVDEGFNITLGTDSLASNSSLSILSEMQTIQQHFPSLGIGKLLEWATINGARFLKMDDDLGTLEPGKTPGLNLITGLDGLKITPETKVKRLV
ncbi:amidohydrolase family protein [Mucilaginibacter sp. Bleaf8]|uniref:amidohydrolase family protein n=1 Tax=Mucilaginibacter sp. Bleaf8 TaxID=2834430 RepID=UPI001BCD9E19|nr:amidohydrolase family protein [Mucilaginibacter sp. Bleaf8]MBS7566051.1 amidohydrolase family protein [Mucilaginibacter sp. Bleaf8]